MSVALALILLGFCLVLQGFFSGSEIALISANRTKLEARSSQGHRGSIRVLKLIQQEERLLGTCLIGTNLSVITGTTIVTTMLLNEGFDQAALYTLGYVPFALVLGEALPKSIYHYYADLLAPILSSPLHLAQILFSPVLWIVSGWSRILTWAAGNSDEQSVSRKDIVMLLDGEEHDSDIDPEEREIIRRVFAMTETTVENCMTPLVDVCAVSENESIGKTIDLVVKNRHSRLPVYRNRIDNIVGIVDHRALLHTEDESQPLSSLVTPVVFVPESKRIDDLLRDMRAEGEQFVVVVDEYGGSVGVVTIEDLLEELVGEIRDEREIELPLIRRIGEREWRLSARAEISDVNQQIGVELPDGDYETVAGLILAMTGRIPESGEMLSVGPLTIIIEQANERAILFVRMTHNSKDL